MRIRFGDCVFDADARQIVREGQPVPLSPKALELLGALLLNRPRALARQELCDLLWPSTFVSYTSLARTVNELRHAIGDDAKASRFVRTVHGFGYAFCGPAADAHALPGPGALFTCGLLWGGREIALSDGDNLIGRAPDCHVRIDSPKISRHHACIRVAGAGAIIEDLESKNGTFVQEKKTEGADIPRRRRRDLRGLGSADLPRGRPAGLDRDRAIEQAGRFPPVLCPLGLLQRAGRPSIKSSRKSKALGSRCTRVSARLSSRAEKSTLQSPSGFVGERFIVLG